MANNTITNTNCPTCDKVSLLEDEGTGVIFCSECKYIVYDGVSDKKAKFAIPKEILRMWSTSNGSDHNVRQSLEDMYSYRTLNLNSIVLYKGAQLFLHAMGMRLSQGRPTRELVASCLYAACRITKTPITLSDISKNLDIRQKNVARCYRMLYQRMNLQIPVADPDKCIIHIAKRANLGSDVTERAIYLTAKAKGGSLLDGRDPTGVAAAALYLACIDLGHPTSQSEIAQASGITEVTIRKNYSLLMNLSDNEETSEETSINRSMIRPGRRRQYKR